MTKDSLYSALEAFISKGYLQEYYSGEDFSIFIFLKTSYVGFKHEGLMYASKCNVSGALLTHTEAQIIIRSMASDAISFLQSKEECSLLFSEKLLSKCASLTGRIILKKKLKKLYSISDKDTSWMLHSFPKMIGFVIIKNSFEKKSELLKQFKSLYKKYMTLGIISFACFFIAMVCLSTIDWRKQFDSDRSSVAFNKNAKVEEYSYIEANVLVPFASLFTTDPDRINSNYNGTYYLWGNTKTKTYGILKFEDHIEELNIFSTEQEHLALDKPIILYGTTKDLPSKITNLITTIQNNPENDTTIRLSDHTITLPDGIELSVPEHPINIPEIPEFDAYNTSVNDNSSIAIDFLVKHGITFDNAIDLGTKYIVTTTAPEKETSLFNKTIDTLSVVGSSTALILFILILVFASKIDGITELIISSFWERVAYESIIPVLVDHNIHICSTNFFNCLNFCDIHDNIFEFTATIPLYVATPTICLYEDDNKTREYVLQTEANEDFTGKYFLISIRLSIHGIPAALAAPVAQIDGFVSDTPENRIMMSDDVGYRMEGHFLACGGTISKQRYKMNRGQDLPMKSLKYQGYTTPSNVRLIGICPDCGKSFCFYGYAFYMEQCDVAYSDDGLDCCKIQAHDIDKDTWCYDVEGKTFRYYNSFHCPHCGAPYIDYKKHPQNKVFGVSGCVHLGKKPYKAEN